MLQCSSGAAVPFGQPRYFVHSLYLPARQAEPGVQIVGDNLPLLPLSQPHTLMLLLIEDSEPDQLLIRENLRRGCHLPHEVVCATSLQDGLDQLRAARFDLVLCDLSLTDARGLQAVQTLTTQWPQVPLVVLTGNDDPQLSGTLIELGAQDHLLKQHLSSYWLGRAIEHALERHKLRLSLESTEEQLRTILDSTIEAIVGIDAHGRVAYANAACARLLEQPARALLGQPADQVLARSELGELCKSWIDQHAAAPTAGTGLRGPATLHRANGQEIALEYSLNPMCHKHGAGGAVLVLQDVSERQRSERAAALALQQAEQLARVRSEFVANMSHEIRTPLNGIIGLTDVMLLQKRLDADSSKLLRHIQESGHLLLAVVNQILDFSKIEAGKLELESQPFSLAEVIDQAVGTNMPAVQAKGLHFSIEEAPDLPAKLMGDRMRLTQVLVNLINNAVKFTPHGSIGLSAEVDLHHTATPKLVLRVTDSGVGLSEQQIERLFDAFVQADTSTTRRFGGTGLGLTISQRIINLMGGSIRAANRPAGGAVFEIVLPLGNDYQAQAPTTTCPVKLVGLPALEAQSFAAELQAWHAEVRTIDSFGHLSRWDLTGPEAEILVLPAEALSDPVTRHHVHAALDAGRCVAVATSVGQPWSMAAEYAGQVIPLDRPLRARHLFERCLPVAAAGQRPSVTGRPTGVHILAAEDNRMNQMVLQQLLEHEGCAVTLAINGEHALSTLQDRGSNEFDLVLADIQMPGMDGYELSRRIARLDPLLPVLALTASTLPEDRYRSFEAGMREHIVKPVDLDTLVACIHRHSRTHLANPAAAPLAH